MVESSVDISLEPKGNHRNSLVRLADEIEALDKQITFWMLLAYGAAAVFNSIVGAGLAAKGLVSGFGSLVNKFGLGLAGEKIDEIQTKRAFMQAEKTLLGSFLKLVPLR
ncbi:hypothetical protein [Microbulbifer epialgicus]|uniref:Uncharacterized protein n=1 Tax=Microbulbifer epialgicus TaxID=393907 RepID=A0ABV4P3H9_9GAMM